MRKNNKGFTLVEILAVIVILLIIVLIAAPNMTKEIKRGEDANQNVLNQKIENAAHLYAAKYYADKIVGNINVTFTLAELEQDGLINLSDSECSSVLDKDISVENGEYNYTNIKDSNCYSCEITPTNTCKK